MKLRDLGVGLLCICTSAAVTVRLGGLGSEVPAQNDFFRQREIAFGFAAWRGMVQIDYPRVLTVWNVPPLDIPTNGLPIRVRSWRKEECWRVDICPQQKGLPYLELRVNVKGDVVSAHEDLMNFFNSMTSTRDCSGCTNNFGDRSYTLGSTAVFARNNIFVRVHSGTNTISAEAVARQIDADILRRSTETGR